MSLINRRQFLSDLCLAGGGLACLPRELWALGGRSATGLVYDPVFLQHRMPDGHPEVPLRLQTIMTALHDGGVAARCQSVPVWQGDAREAVLTMHTEEHVRRLTVQHPDSESVARAVVGGILAATDAVCGGTLQNAFCATRPPGHHALSTGRIEGFCLYNGIAIAAHHARVRHGLERVLIVDWDYHHGNATQEMFYRDPGVMFFSTHDYYAYPGTGDPALRGAGRGLGYNINVHLDCGATDDDIIAAFEAQLLPRAEQYRPQLILISAGFDSRQDDPLGCFRVSDRGFTRLSEMVRELAATHCDGRIVSVLEGGYDVQGTASAARAHVEALLAA